MTRGWAKFCGIAVLLAPLCAAAEVHTRYGIVAGVELDGLRFAAKGDPNGDEVPEWPRYDRNAEINLEFGEKVQVNRRLHAAQCEVMRFTGHTSGIPGGSF